MDHNKRRTDRNSYNKVRSESGYGVWANIVQRCCNPNHPLYKKYGEKGITICDRWRYSYKNFLTDMGPRVDCSYSIDRIDNSKGYFPENCRWASKTVQSINRNKQQNNSSGYPGISWDKSRNKWFTSIQINHRQINLGRFDDIEEAISMRLFAEQKYFKPLLG